MLVVAFTLDGFGLLRFQFSCFSYLGVRTFTQVFMKRECIGLMKALQTSIVMWALTLCKRQGITPWWFWALARFSGPRISLGGFLKRPVSTCAGIATCVRVRHDVLGF